MWLLAVPGLRVTDTKVGKIRQCDMFYKRGTHRCDRACKHLTLISISGGSWRNSKWGLKSKYGNKEEPGKRNSFTCRENKQWVQSLKAREVKHLEKWCYSIIAWEVKSRKRNSGEINTGQIIKSLTGTSRSLGFILSSRGRQQSVFSKWITWSNLEFVGDKMGRNQN